LLSAKTGIAGLNGPRAVLGKSFKAHGVRGLRRMTVCRGHSLRPLTMSDQQPEIEG